VGLLVAESDWREFAAWRPLARIHHNFFPSKLVAVLKMRFDALSFLLPFFYPTVSSTLFSGHRIAHDKLSLILVGNIGAGKSFIGNLLVNRVAFNSKLVPPQLPQRPKWNRWISIQIFL
jgi:hypothetical protein